MSINRIYSHLTPSGVGIFSCIRSGKDLAGFTTPLPAYRPQGRRYSWITNKPKPRSSGLVSPIAPRKTENHTKGAFGGTFSFANNGRAGVAPRTALGDITNGVESCKAPASAVKQKKARGKNAKIGSNPRCELTEEEKQKANAWARERIERVQFSGKDMEVLKAKMAKIAEEVAGKGHGHSVSGAVFEEYKLYDFSTWLQHRVKSSGSWNNIKSCVRDAGVCRKLGQKSVNAASFYQQHLTPIQESTVALMEMRKKSHNIGKKILVAIEISSNALPCEKT